MNLYFLTFGVSNEFDFLTACWSTRSRTASRYNEDQVLISDQVIIGYSFYYNLSIAAIITATDCATCHVGLQICPVRNESRKSYLVIT